jgi:hypothetical protein
MCLQGAASRLPVTLGDSWRCRHLLLGSPQRVGVSSSCLRNLLVLLCTPRESRLSFTLLHGVPDIASGHPPVESGVIITSSLEYGMWRILLGTRSQASLLLLPRNIGYWDSSWRGLTHSHFLHGVYNVEHPPGKNRVITTSSTEHTMWSILSESPPCSASWFISLLLLMVSICIRPGDLPNSSGGSLNPPESSQTLYNP